MTTLRQLIPKYQQNPSKESVYPLFLNMRRLIVHAKDCTKFLDFEEIEYLQAASNYTYILLTNQKRLVVSKTLKHLSLNLDDFFIRTHKSFIVNLKHVTHYHAQDAMITMRSGNKISVSRTNKTMMKVIFS